MNRIIILISCAAAKLLIIQDHCVCKFEELGFNASNVKVTDLPVRTETNWNLGNIMAILH